MVKERVFVKGQHELRDRSLHFCTECGELQVFQGNQSSGAWSGGRMGQEMRSERKFTLSLWKALGWSGGEMTTVLIHIDPGQGSTVDLGADMRGL